MISLFSAVGGGEEGEQRQSRVKREIAENPSSVTFIQTDRQKSLLITAPDSAELIRYIVGANGPEGGYMIVRERERYQKGFNDSIRVERGTQLVKREAIMLGVFITRLTYRRNVILIMIGVNYLFIPSPS